METILDKREIAEIYDLKYIETTSDGNGYPSNIKGAIIGFETFEQAQELAEITRLEIQIFSKKDGWSLWYRTGHTAFTTFENSARDFGDNYTEVYAKSEEEFITEEVSPFLEDNEFTSFDEIEEFLKSKKELWEAIEDAEEDEIVIAHEGRFYETIKGKSMSFSHDTKTSTIGLI